VRASRDLITIILSNLITNSIKYSPAATTVTIAASGEGDEVHFTVKDQGMGIEAGELDRVFEEFYRTRRAREREKDGTGLGLAIIKRAVESLHGSIRVYSEVDSGTEFHVRIPKGVS
jgi:two-component system sensor histidine kinase SenX3